MLICLLSENRQDEGFLFFSYAREQGQHNTVIKPLIKLTHSSNPQPNLKHPLFCWTRNTVRD